LVVESDAIMRQVMRIALRAAGLCVVGEAGTAAEALRLHGHFQPDVVVLDEQLFGSNGSALLAQIKTAHARTRVIVVTGSAATVYTRDAQTKAADGVIARPFAPSKLVETVRQCLARAPRPHAA
jgi:two-component system nitrate/nitrite response regulator NarL